MPWKSQVIPVDDEFVELNLSRSWMAESKEAREGIFLSVLSDSLSETLRERAEFFIYKLWQMSEAYISTST